MEMTDSSREIVCLLADWVALAANAREATRTLMEPFVQQRWRSWMLRKVKRYYFESLNRTEGYWLEDFVADCSLLVLRWAQGHPEELRQPDFTDRELGYVVSKMAKRWCFSLCRRYNRRQIESLEAYLSQTEPEILQSFPLSLQATQDHALLNEHPLLPAQLRQARQLLREFASSLRGQRKMRQMLATLLRYARRLEKIEGFPLYLWLLRAYLWVLQVLRARKEHFPPEARDYLRNRFPHLDYSVISGRLVYLRRTFREFLLRRVTPAPAFVI